MKRTMLCLAICSGLAVSTVNADSSDSVFSWGSWNGVRTAAGPDNPPQPLVYARKVHSGGGGGAKFEPLYKRPEQDSGYRAYSSWGEASEQPAHMAFGSQKAAIALALDGGEGGFQVTNQGGEISSAQGLNLVPSKYAQRYFTDQIVVIPSGRPKKKGPPAEVEQALVVPVEGNHLAHNLDEENAVEYGFWGVNREGAFERGGFLAGQAMALESLNQIVNNAIAGDAVVSYSGSFVRNAGAALGYVNIEVDFATKSWGGNFSSMGFGSFEVNKGTGTIQGVDLKGSVDSNGITGTVDASFFGKSAQTIGGITDVSKDGVQFVEVFKADARIR